MNRPNLAALLDKWTSTLRLRDWKIDLNYSPRLATEAGPVHGLCMPFVHDRRAQILINDPATPHEGCEEESVEDTLVHELLHLIFAPFGTTTKAEIALEEQAVWTLTSAIRSGADREVVARAMAARSTDRTRKQAPMPPNTARRAEATNSTNNLASLTERIDALEIAFAKLLLESGKGEASNDTTTEAKAQRARLDAKMGIDNRPRIERVGHAAIFRPMTPEQARTTLAARRAGR